MDSLYRTGPPLRDAPELDTFRTVGYRERKNATSG
ncbi:hypothetical protein M2192_005874 [Bradyrhizobium elkanii USDA 61]|nr:hypothetical protein [Bradyrhizobium elkanii]MCS3581628.1 hypothetical protein [Bradyrhizobium elkanii]MCS3724502.1 hypothetical protein [Bradyrhizobium elkanii]MCS4008914.1 hypothetical protein [Bradyrhizobium elkanii USDA 61]